MEMKKDHNKINLLNIILHFLNLISLREWRQEKAHCEIAQNLCATVAVITLLHYDLVPRPGGVENSFD